MGPGFPSVIVGPEVRPCVTDVRGKTRLPEAEGAGRIRACSVRIPKWDEGG